MGSDALLKRELTDTETDSFCLLAEQKYNLKRKKPSELQAQSYENLETPERSGHAEK